MRYWLLFLLSCLAGGVSGSLWGSTNQSKPLVVPFAVTPLDNGLTLVTYESHKVPLVTIMVTFRSGAFAESPQVAGLTRLWQQVFWQGMAPDKGQSSAEYLAGLGMVYESEAAVEYVRHYLTLPSARLAEGLATMRRGLRNGAAAWGTAEWRTAIDATLGDFDQRATKPGFELALLRRRLLYRDQWLRRDAIGNPEVVASAKPAQLAAWLKRFVVPSEGALLVAGDFVPRTLQDLVTKHFGDWQVPAGFKPLQAPPLPAFPKSETFVMVRPQAKDVAVTLTFAGPKVRHDPEATYAVDVLAGLLQLKEGSFQKSLVASGLGLAAGLNYLTQNHAGELNLYGRCPAKRTSAFVKALTAQPQAWLAPNYFTKAQISAVQRSMRVAHYLERDRPSSFIKVLGFWWSVAGLDYYRDYYNKMFNVTALDLQKFIKKYLIAKPALTTIYTSPDGAKQAKLQDNASALVETFLEKT